MSKDLLLEIGTEELPHLALREGREQLEARGRELFADNKLNFQSIQVYGTPRRLVLLVRGLEERQEDQLIKIKGPSQKVFYDQKGEPTRAAFGFLNSHKASLQEVNIEPTEKGEYVFIERTKEGQPTEKLLPQLLRSIILSFSFAKSMRWGDSNLRFARPIRWLLCLFGDCLINVEVENLISGSVTYGHRFLSQNPIQVEKVEDYFRLLRENYVIVDQEERKKIILDQLEKASQIHKFHPLLGGELVEEVVDLVENPQVVVAEFSARFLTLPREVLETSMKSHQRYFPLESLQGELLPAFIFIQNGSLQAEAEVRKGNERVLSARLTDATFFWEEDLKKHFAQLTPQLSGVIFQEKLGNMLDKVKRLEKLVPFLVQKTGLDLDLAAAERAAYLCKTDLITDMVVEFPDLQGVMGREYTQRQGEEPSVCQAIFEHYLPRSLDDPLPRSPEGSVLAVADKMDTLVGIFGIGLIPSGSQDPYALRRKARGIIQITLDKEMDWSLTELISFIHRLYGEQGAELRDQDTLKQEVIDFLLQRFRYLLSDQGYQNELIDSVIDVTRDRIVVIKKKVEALAPIIGLPEMEDLATAYERCNNLSRGWEMEEVDPGLLQEEQEKVMYERLVAAERKTEENARQYDYAAMIKNLAPLRPVVDSFFDRVLVMVEEDRIRANRLSLLRRYVLLFNQLANFSLWSGLLVRESQQSQE